MNNSKLFILLGLLSVISSIQKASADVLPDFSKYLDQKMTQIESSMEGLEASSSDNLQFVIQDMNLDFTPAVSFGFSNVLSLTITPEIDIVLVPNQE